MADFKQAKVSDAAQHKEFNGGEWYTLWSGIVTMDKVGLYQEITERPEDHSYHLLTVSPIMTTTAGLSGVTANPGLNIDRRPLTVEEKDALMAERRA